MGVEIRCTGPAETMAVGRRLASLLRPGDVVLIEGDLGAGKTTFIAGVAEGLGVDEEITSPTFILARTYSGLVPLTHADVYRMDTLGEVADLDLIEEAADGVLMIEWGTAVEQSMPASRLVVHLEVSGQDTRILRFDPLGDWSDRPLEELEL
ncbi:MAG: tRNA (adenosine(37)-N6)-threonylcarbamoyltransferase complex ATPase subunit type 1 TsaE [Acidimicrobiia bacterium]|jgi:tRNA threonylcarbamoyladenosine biosynthesis protein TsaE